MKRWALGVAALSLVPVIELFTATRIFYVRDLSFFFWSRHLWLRHTIFSGQAPWWDPHVAAGQSAIADALNQIVMPITLAIRLLPSDVVSFNLWVALPLPIAALGTFVFLRRYFAPESADAAAAFGACIFALSGPVVSTLNMPNLAWSVALMPWVLAASAATPLRPARPAEIALAFGLQGLCGEPVTWATTGFLTGAWILLHGPVVSGARRKFQLLAGLALGGLLAAAQVVPAAAASVRAHRDAISTPDFWSLHPLSLWETIVPHLFGNYYDAFLADLPWMGALNFGRDPLLYSIYVGPLVVVLACAGAARLRRNWFWVVAAVALSVAALGGYTPLYPLLRRLVPSLMYFRFPVKYLVVAVLSAAVLAAEGWRAGKGTLWLSALAGSVILAVTLVFMAVPEWLAAATRHLAVITHLKDPAAGGEFLARVAPPLALRTGGMLMAAALLTVLARRRPYAWTLIAIVACADLLAASMGLSPTMEIAQLSPPSWFTAAAGPQRIYIGARVRGYMNSGDPDGVATWQMPAESTAIAGRMVLNAELPMAPSGWRVREALSYDLPYLWPTEYETAVKRFEASEPEQRDAFLRRAGVRWCVLPASRETPASWRAIADVSDWNMRVFDCHPDASRVTFVSEVGTLEAMFDPSAPDGEPLGDARIVEDAGTRLTIEASASRPAILVLRDSFDPSWHAEVDGQPVTVLRANRLYRGVALSPGHHVIRFSYRPRDFLAGLILSVAAVFIIGLLAWRTSADSR